MGFKPIQVNCKNCGADLQLDPTLRISNCSYCGSTITMTKDEIPGNWPDVDFIYEDKITELEYDNIISKYFTESVYTPDDLLDAHEKVHSYLSYLPFYIYSIEWTASWSADAGYRKTRQKWSETSKKYINEGYIEWHPVSGSAEGIIGDLHAPGAVLMQNKSFSEKLIPLAESIDSSASTDFEPQLLEGASWLSFDSKPDDTYKNLVASRVEAHIRDICTKQIPGDKQRNLSVSARKTFTYKKGIIPFWIFNYKYNKTNYLTVVDAVNGSIKGERPSSSKRIAVVFGYVLAPLGMFISLYLVRIAFFPQASISDGIVWTAIVIGLLSTGGILSGIYHALISSFKKDFTKLSSQERSSKVHKIKSFEKKYYLITSLALFVIIFVLNSYQIIGDQKVKWDNNRRAEIASQVKQNEQKAIKEQEKIQEQKNQEAKSKIFEAFHEKEKKAEAGDLDAQYELADEYLSGSIKKDLAKSYLWLKKSADGGNPKAQYFLGRRLIGGTGGADQNIEQGMTWLKKASENGYNRDVYLKEIEKLATAGNSKAQYMMSVFYLNADGVKYDSLKVFDWLSKSMTQSYSRAIYVMGRLYSIGGIIEKNSKKSEDTLKLASDLGYKPEEYIKTMEYYAESGIPSFQLMLSNCFSQGIGRKQDLNKAQEWLKKAVSNELPSAQEQYAISIINKNPEEAIKLLELAAKSNMPDAQFNLYIIYGNGLNVKKDTEKANEYFNQALQNKNPSALDVYGTNLLKDAKGNKDKKEAIEWLEMSALLGNSNAANTLYKFYEENKLAEEKVEQWLNRAAELGNPEACFILFNAIRGEGHEKKKITLLESAASSKDPYVLFECYKMSSKTIIMIERAASHGGNLLDLERAIKDTRSDLKPGEMAQKWLNESVLLDFQVGKIELGLLCYYKKDYKNALKLLTNINWNKYEYAWPDYRIKALRENIKTIVDQIELSGDSTTHEGLTPNW